MDSPDTRPPEDHGTEEPTPPVRAPKTPETNALGAREFVSDRDGLEDAWARSGEHSARDEGW